MTGPSGIIRIANCYSGFYVKQKSREKRGVYRFKTVLSRLLIATPQAFSQLKSDIPLLKMLQKDFGPDGNGEMSQRTVDAFMERGYQLAFFPVRGQADAQGLFGIRLAAAQEQAEFAKATEAVFKANVRNIEITSRLLGIEFVNIRESRLTEAELRVLLARVCVERNPDPLGVDPIEEVIGMVSVHEEGDANMPDTLIGMPDGRMHLKITKAKLKKYAEDPPEFGIGLTAVEG